MKIPSLLLFVSVLQLAGWGCVGNLADLLGLDAFSGTVLGGKYIYAGFGADGAQIVEGVITITLEDAGRVSGTWELKAVGSAPANGYGPQIGSGTMMGMVDSARITLNLNPQYVDNNVILLGTFSRTTISGTWEYVGFPGVLGRGTFRAVRITGRQSTVRR